MKTQTKWLVTLVVVSAVALALIPGWFGLGLVVGTLGVVLGGQLASFVE